MVRVFLSTIAELIFSAVAKAVHRLSSLENAFELVSGLFGLAFIVIGVATLLFGH
jgi:hypothetical protein